CFLFAWVAALGLLDAQPTITIQAEAQPKEIYIGDPIQLQVTVVFSSSVQPAVFTPPAILGDFELLAFQSSPIENTPDGRRVQKHVLVLTTFSTGTLTLPGLTLAFSEIGGPTVEQKTPDIQIHVKSLLEEKGDQGNLRPLKG